MRVYLLWFVIAALSAYALRDYFKPTLFLVLMMAFYGHPDMPSNIAGIQGLNPWNLLMLFCIAGYLINKKKEGNTFDLPSGMSTLFLIFVVFSFVSTTRLLLDFDTFKEIDPRVTTGALISEYYINQMKWLVPAFLIFAGARTPDRRWWALAAIIGVHLLVAAITIRRVPIGSVASGGELTQKGLKVLEQAFGWSRVNTAMLLAGAAWAVMFASGYLIHTQRLLKREFQLKWAPPFLFLLTSVALALTGGRMGWGAWLVLALVFTAWRWRKGLLILPVAVVAIVAMVPALQERLLQGVSTEGGTTIEDTSELTSGRTTAWPVVLRKIEERPILGYGALAMQRTGADQEVRRLAKIPEGERGFPHPHNAYLLLLFDAGVLGAIPILLLYILILKRSAQITRIGDPEATAVGMTTISLVLALMVAGLGSQNFYPVQGNIAMWAAVALMLRIHTDVFVLGHEYSPSEQTLEEDDEFEGDDEEDELEDIEVTPLWTRAKGTGYGIATKSIATKNI